jgi:hypothetical protein
LPDALLVKIFGHLNRTDRENASEVCRRWKEVAETTAQDKEKHKYKVFTKALAKNLDPKTYPNVIKLLKKVCRREDLLIGYALPFRDELYRILLGISNEIVPKEIYAKTSEQLTQLREFEAAAEAVKIMMNTTYSHTIAIIKNALATGNVEAAIDLLTSDYLRDTFSPTLLDVLKGLVQTGKWDQAHSIAIQIAPSFTGDIIRVFLDARNLYYALIIALHKYHYIDETPNENLDLVIKAFCEEGKVDEAISIAEQRKPDDTSRYNFLLKIVKALVDRGDFEKALNVAERLIDTHYYDRFLFRSNSFKYISDELIASKEFEKALDVIKKIPHEETMAGQIKQLCKALIDDGKYDKAIEISNFIDTRERMHYTIAICLGLVSVQEFEQARSLATRLQDRPTQAGLNLWISSKMHSNPNDAGIPIFESR